jgi:glycosyltransferase involved in cell wall biosynthesis
MHIGISTSVIQRGQTGIAQYLFALLRGFIDRDTAHQFTLFILEEDLPHFRFVGSRARLVTVPEEYRPPVRNVLWHQTRLPQLAREHQVDVLHVPSYRRLLWPRPCALVATIHDLAPFRLAGKYDWKRMFYGRVVVPQLAKRQDQLIAISQNTAHDIAAFFRLPTERIAVIPNGLDHHRFFPSDPDEAKSQVAQRYNLQRPFFLYVARLEHPGKNHLRLIAAFEQFKAAIGSDWQLALGGSDWHGAAAIHTAIRKSPIAEDIRCLGFVPDAELPALYNAAEVFVFPSLYEGFGMPPIEAMACGCPVISSTCGSLAEVVGPAAALVDAEDTDSISAQLCLLASDERARNRLRAAGFIQTRKFNWSTTAAETLKVYERALEYRASLVSPAQSTATNVDRIMAGQNHRGTNPLL